MELIGVLIGLIVGGTLAWYIARLKIRGDEKIARQRICDLNEENDSLKQEFKDEQAKTMELSKQLSVAETDYKNLRERMDEQKKELHSIQEKFSQEFQILANNIFEEKTKKFTDLNRVNLAEVLNPLKDKIVEFEKKVDQTNRENIERNSALREQLIGLKELNQRITKEAENLTRALKGDTKTQGNWGEFILESILENSGLEKNREYVIQDTYFNEEGRRFQPDVIVKLPEDKNIVIDSKVTLVAYERYVSNENEREKATYLKSHLQAVRTRIKELSKKEYQTRYGVKGLDFILMFIPIEPAFSLAVQHDSNLFNEAYEKNIVIVSPTTLIATLRTISNIWKNEYQNRNAMEIARQGGDLYDKFVGFTEDLKSVGKHIDATQQSYLEAMKKLYLGKGDLVSRAQKIKKLGAKTSKSLDPKLIER
ncbi:MAG: DNA recombination protein RmuC, partial [Bacteroidetes bacterium]|nr:DNA recombination protein RmuC [Bacteroidota bacterium]